MAVDDVVQRDVDERRRRRVAFWWLGSGAVVAVATIAVGVTLSSLQVPVTGRGPALESLPTHSPLPGATPSPTSTPNPPVDASSDPESPTVPVGESGEASDEGAAAMSAVERVWADARGEIDAAALERDDCLDDVAAAYAATAAEVGGSGEEPTVPKASCGGGVKLGYALGFDESGVGQATAALTMTADGPSPIVSTSAREVGYALVPTRGATGEVNGYVLAWAVSK